MAKDEKTGAAVGTEAATKDEQVRGVVRKHLLDLLATDAEVRAAVAALLPVHAVATREVATVAASGLVLPQGVELRPDIIFKDDLRPEAFNSRGLTRLRGISAPSPGVVAPPGPAAASKR